MLNLRLGLWRRGTRGDRPRDRFRRNRRHHGRRCLARHRAEQVHHEAVALAAARTQHEALLFHLAVQVEHDAQAIGAVLAATDALHLCAADVHRVQRRREFAVLDVDDQPLGVVHFREAVAHRAVHVEHEARVIRAAPQAQALDRDTGARLQAAQREHQGEADAHAHRVFWP